jgi:hypothetical protein
MSAGQKLTSVLPNFLIVGAQKAGTTSLYSILKQHSQIYMHPKKELHFFDRDSDYEDGVNFYASYFRNTGEASAVGEATPAYLFLPEIPGRIVETLGGEMKIIAILRNPVDRAFSQFRMLANMGLEKRSLEEAFSFNLNRLRNQGITFEKETSYLDRGLYSVQIENYFRFFSKEQIRIFLFEDDFLNNTSKMISDIQEFLEVDVEELNTMVREIPARRVKNDRVDQMLNTAHPVNQFLKKVIPSKKLRAFVKLKMNGLNTENKKPEADWDMWRERLIKTVFYDDIKKTETLINRDLSGWYKGFV